MAKDKKLFNIYTSPVRGSKISVLVGLLCVFYLFPLKSFSQYYPAPTMVSPAQLPSLLGKLRSISSPDQQVKVLNSLSNLYFNLPLKNPRDIAIALRYAQKALDQSVKYNDAPGRAYAVLMLGQIMGFDDKLQAAVRLLPLVDDTTRVKLLLQISYFYLIRPGEDFIHDCDHCIDFAGQAALLSQKLKLTDLALMSERNIATANANLEKPDAETGLLDILAKYQKAGYRKLHYIFTALTAYYRHTGLADKAYFYSQAAVNSVNATKDSAAAGDIYYQKGGIDLNRQSYNEAIQTAEMAIKFYRRYSGMHNITSPTLYNLISIAYNKMGKSREGINYVRKAMNEYPPRNVEDSLSYLHILGHGYREMKHFEESEYFFRQYYAISFRNHTHMYDANTNLGQLFLDSRQYGKARFYLYKAFSSPQFTLQRTAAKRQMHYMLFLADSATQHYLDAIKHQTFLSSQAEFDARLEKDKEVKKMEIAYKALEKEQEIKLKNQSIAQLKQQAVAEQEQLKQSRKISMLYAGGFVLTLAVLVLGYFLYRQNRQSAKHMVNQNHLLQTLVSEKEWLLKEVHHRVKNNLHTIFCLLESQGRTARLEVRDALEKSQNRIYAMSLFHQKVYQSGNIEQVDFELYIKDFLIFLEDSFDLESRNIRMERKLDQVSLPVKLAMPLALIINETLTNAVKYAFVDRQAGVIKIEFEKAGPEYRLSIADNGIGISEANLNQNRSLGIELIYGLCADIGAQVKFQVKNGTDVQIKINQELLNNV